MVKDKFFCEQERESKRERVRERERERARESAFSPEGAKV